MAAVSIRYARAFVDVLLEHKLDVRRALAELNEMAELVRTSDDLRKIWENPSIPAEQKRALLKAIAARAGYSEEATNFAAVIIDHRRVPLMPQIARQAQSELFRRLGITEAEITVAHPLPLEGQRELEAQIARSTGGKSVQAIYRTDPSILGGAVVRIGSTIYDGSVKGQLRKIKEAIAGA